MAIGILGEVRNIQNVLSYIPKEDCGARSFTLVRSNKVLGQSKVKPLLMCDLNFWAQDIYELMVQSIANAVTRDWTSPQQAGTKVKGGQGINSDDWTTYRGDDYKNTVMIGMMIAKLTYGVAVGKTNAPTDYLVSAAPNVLYNSKKKSYLDHIPKGDNDGTQIHSEMSMAAQLKALFVALGNSRNFVVTDLKCDADIFIEKGSMCDGCLGTWTQLAKSYPGVIYRSV